MQALLLLGQDRMTHQQLGEQLCQTSCKACELASHVTTSSQFPSSTKTIHWKPAGLICGKRQIKCHAGKSSVRQIGDAKVDGIRLISQLQKSIYYKLPSKDIYLLDTMLKPKDTFSFAALCLASPMSPDPTL